MSVFSTMKYLSEHRADIAQILVHIGWEQRYIEGQLQSIDTFAADTENAHVVVARANDVVVGFITVQFYQWNRLAQIHGLAVDPSMRKRGIAADLVTQAEHFVLSKGGRGVYVDTPVTNTGARTFYSKQGYQQDYIMTAYYDENLDGVTYLKLFNMPEEL